MARSNNNDVAGLIRLAQEANYDANVIAQKLRLSTRQLRRRSVRLFGVATRDWLNEQRCVAACSLLSNGDTIKEASYALGFKQISHFCRTFKNYNGLTPTEYVEAARNG